MLANQIAQRALPEHVLENYPALVSFMESFYEWSMRSGFLTSDEFEFLLSRFPEIEWNDSSIQGQAYRSRNRLREHNLVREFDFFETTDHELFETADGELFETEFKPLSLDLWYAQFGDFTRVGLGTLETYDTFSLSTGRFLDSGSNLFRVRASNTFTTFRDLDETRLIKLLKIIYGMKGSVGTITAFFNFYFGEVVTVERTKDKISRIDDNFVLDGDNHLRDDNKYSEYSFVVKVSRELSVYTELFESIYLKHFHPAGFKVFLEKRG